MSISFQKKENGYDHQIEMPDVAGPENLSSDLDMVKKYKFFVPDHIFQVINERPFEFRMVEQVKILDFKTKLPYRNFWFKANENFEADINIHQRLLTYVSDYNLLTTATLPHTMGPLPNKDLFMASLDHGMWFHRDFRIDDWLLYAMDSPSASNARGFARGNIFNKEGILVASVVQEGLMRLKKMNLE